MANVQTFQPVDYFNLSVFWGDVTRADAGTIVVQTNGQMAAYTGNFQYVNDDVFGTLNGFQLFNPGGIVFNVDAIGKAANPIYNLIQAGRATDAIEFALSTDDAISGSSGNDVLGGFAGNDLLVGNLGDDQLRGGAGNDILYGNQGTDSLYGNEGADILYGGQDADGLYGGQDNDQLFGNMANDALFGNLGDDYLHGGQGNDYLHGGQGNDTLNGGTDDDILQGGLGADRFEFGRGHGNDEVVDLNRAEGDRIDLQGQAYTVSSRDGSAVLHLEGGGSVVLHGVQIDDLGWVFV